MERLDVVLVKRGLVESRLSAKRLIMAGAVKVNDISKLKPGQRISPNDEIEVKSPPKYVSRGGVKLEKALEEFQININERVAIDVGASTGGFTDCLLQHGAAQVYAVDVGYGQLAWTLQQDNRVHVLDRSNIRYINPQLFSLPLEIAVIDVSFISLKKVLPVIIQELAIPEIVALVKPQFEAGREHVKKGGIVDDPNIHKVILINLFKHVHQNYSIKPVGLTFSPVHKDIANIEYLLWLRELVKNGGTVSDLADVKTLDTDSVVRVVDAAHREFYTAEKEK